MTDPIRLARPDVGEAELAAVAEVLRTGQLTMGAKVSEFEEAIARAVGTAHTAVVSSGTAALHLALLALEIGPGDEVIVPAYTFPATANVVELCGARAVLVDVDRTFTIDVAAVAAAVGPDAGCHGIFPRPPGQWEAQTAVPRDVALVEDAAGARGDLPRDALRRARRHGLPLTPAQDRDDGRGRRHDGRGFARCRGTSLPPPWLGGARRHARAGVQLPPARSPVCDRHSQSSASRLLAARERSRGGTRAIEHHVLTPSVSEGDRHGGKAYVVQLDRRDGRSVRSRRRDRGADRNVGAPPARAVPGAGRLPGRRSGIRARARAPVCRDDHRGGGRAGRGGVDIVVSEC